MIKMMMLLLMATVALTVIMIKKMNCWVFAAILICGVTSVKAQDFYDFSAVSSSGDTLYYYLDEGVAVVTCPGDIDKDDYWPEGIAQPQGGDGD